MWRGPAAALPETPGSLGEVPGWRRVAAAERALSSFSEAGLAAWPSADSAAWRTLRARLEQAPLHERAVAVNRFFNGKAFVSDKDNWGLDDYWATPSEFMRRSGDCEDYAAAKYFALRDLGVAAQSMRIAGVLDRSAGNAHHAVLLLRMDGGWLVMDNLHAEPYPFKATGPYAPVYFTNEDGLWRHPPTNH